MSGAGMEVLEPGPFTTMQDEGRLGVGGLGIGRSGACDRTAYRLANRLVGNVAGAPALEVTFGGLAVRARAAMTVAISGARCPGVPHLAPITLRTGDVLRLGTPVAGLRSYVSVRGGFDVAEVLGSASYDVLSGLGPAPVQAGARLLIGGARLAHPVVDIAPVPEPSNDPVTLQLLPGPRQDWFDDAASAQLTSVDWTVGTDSNRVGVRLSGPVLARTAGHAQTELPSEGLLRGAIQVPPNGAPVAFLADHPVTGGYPVISYIADVAHNSDVDRLAQVRPGQQVRFRP